MIHQGFWRERFHCKKLEWHAAVWQSSTNRRGRRTFDVIGKRDPLLKKQGALGWLSRCCTDEAACTHTHRGTHVCAPIPNAHSILCFYFPLKQELVPVVVHKCELIWLGVMAKKVQHDKKEAAGVSAGCLVESNLMNLVQFSS